MTRRAGAVTATAPARRTTALDQHAPPERAHHVSTDEQAERTVGSVPNAYGNAIAWRWARQLPTSLKRTGFLTLLYALRAIAAASGELRFPDGKAIRIQDIAKAAGCDERDARDRIGAALAAGVVAVKGERRRGVATLYALVIHPQPDWAAAAAFIAAAKLAREEAKAERARRKAALRAEEAAPEFGG